MSNQWSVKISELGLKKYLDETKDRHNGEGYDRFVFYMKPELRMNNAAVGRIFSVTRKTISKWKKIYLEEQGRGQSI